ncbi:MAG: hypothetical protein M1833_004072 [Piccolia ochrophora]|nr:MAG: hypothetical protein M1833_004072 [Piccolia ochrophora]
MASSATPPGQADPPQSYTSMETADMESIGAHCQMPFCRQLDFLPFRCESCKGTYCLDHRTEHSHSCSHAGAWAAARRSKALSSTPSSSSVPRTTTTPSPCASPSCKTTINTPLSTGVHCTTCNRSYCLKHRLQEDHACSTLTPLGARPSKPSTGASQTDKARLAFSRLKAWSKEKQTDLLPKPKPTSAAARTAALNTLKRSAKGDAKVPVDARVYLHVEAVADATPSSAKNPKGAFFFSKDWSVGRLLDVAAKSLQVANVNNRGGGEGERLRVFHVEGGRVLGFQEKVGETCVSGNTVVLLRGVGEPIPDLIEA